MRLSSTRTSNENRSKTVERLIELIRCIVLLIVSFLADENEQRSSLLTFIRENRKVSFSLTVTDVRPGAGRMNDELILRQYKAMALAEDEFVLLVLGYGLVPSHDGVASRFAFGTGSSSTTSSAASRRFVVQLVVVSVVALRRGVIGDGCDEPDFNIIELVWANLKASDSPRRARWTDVKRPT